MNFLVALATNILTKLGGYLLRVLALFIEKKQVEKKVDGEVDELKNAVNDAKVDGVISAEEEKRIRDASRNLIDGAFDSKL